jgi:hypothetical protein
MLLISGKLTSSEKWQEPLDLPTSLAWPIADRPIAFPVPEDIWSLTGYPRRQQQSRENTH